MKGALLEIGTLCSSIPLQTSLSTQSCWKKQHLIICLFMFSAFVVSSHGGMNSWEQWKVRGFFFETQVRWREVTLIQPLLVHRTMTLYNRQATGRSPHGFTICSQFSFPPSLYRSSPSSPPPPPLFPSSCRLDSALESCERTWTSCFFLVLSLSAISVRFLHMLPRCHLLQTLSRHPVKSTFFFNSFCVLITEISLPTM